MCLSENSNTYHTTYLTPVNILILWSFFHDNLGKLAPERYETFLDLINSRDDAVELASAGPYANYLHLVPDS